MATGVTSGLYAAFVQINDMQLKVWTIPALWVVAYLFLHPSIFRRRPTHPPKSP
jgi:hypothetical protein